MTGPARVLAAAGITGLLAGCNAPLPLPRVTPPVAEAPPASAQERPRVVSARFDCGGTAWLISFFADHLVMTKGEGEVFLQPAPSASGALYANGDITFWNKGSEGTLEWDGEVAACRELPDPWKHAADRNVDVRAIGQEPGWLAEIAEGRSIHLVYDYAERELTTNAPVKTIAPGRTTYAGVAGAQQVTVVVEEKACADAMSGESFLLAVTVTIDDRELDGCGRTVVQLAR